MTDEIQYKASLPLYMRISEVMVRDIASGRLIDGERLPPERKLAKQYGTTVRTLRKALDILFDRGLLRRVQGSGNYVQSSGDAAGIYSLFRLELVNGGGLPTARVIDVKLMEKADDLPQFGKSNKASRIRRLRYLDAFPVAIEEIWLDADAGIVRPELLSDSLYQYYHQQLGFWIDYVEDFISVGTVPDWLPADFGPASGQTVGLVERFSFAGSEQAVEYSRNWFDPQLARYAQRLR